MATALNPTAKKQQAQLRAMLKSTDVDVIRKGCATLATLAADPELRAVVEVLAEGTEINGRDRLVVGKEVQKRVRSAHRVRVALCALRALGRMADVRRLTLTLTDTLTDLDPLAGLPSLESLDANSCPLTNLDGISDVTTLEMVCVRINTVLQNVEGLTGLTRLRLLHLTGCKSLTSVEALAGLTNLKTLYLDGCKSLTSVDCLAGLPKLETLTMERCPSLLRKGLEGKYESRAAVEELQARLRQAI
jgi:hypothetical protein